MTRRRYEIVSASELGLPLPEEPHRRRRSLPARLSLVGGAVLAIVILVWGGGFVFRFVTFPPFDSGRCFVLWPTWCVSRSEAWIEEKANLQLPEGSTIVESASSEDFFSTGMSALVTLPPDTDVELGSGYAQCLYPSTTCLSDDEREYFESRDLTRDRSFADKDDQRSGTIISFGHDDEGTVWVYIRSHVEP
ncbi:hypothetical protein [Paramicrobacterium chengjingii]|uniref:Uncharacterized protein n=1 Tax=Paramicrobacterium chengjingii TaxID=2769067 RepID=A0ABX6YIJ8_9MICO|nr:hypothetical protein [Microbacterium chengjingii]QPZ38633.1 hypothetical protein HCR76_00520 [Microbacterium chengjingii]